MTDIFSSIDPAAIIAAVMCLISAAGNIVQKLRNGSISDALRDALDAKDKILDYFDYSSDTNEAPQEVLYAAQHGRNLYQLTAADKERIISTCASAVEAQQVSLYIVNMESVGTYEYTVETTGAGYLIQQGWIAQVTLHTDGTGKARPVNAEGQTVGAVTVDTVVIGGKAVLGGETFSISDICGSEIRMTVTGTSLGQVVIGAVWDSQSCGEQTVTINRIGEQKTILLRMPQYRSSFNNRRSHDFSYRIGRYAGHDDVTGDKIEWDACSRGSMMLFVTDE